MAEQPQMLLACGHACDRKVVSEGIVQPASTAVASADVTVEEYLPSDGIGLGTLHLRSLISSKDLQNAPVKGHNFMLASGDSGTFKCPKCQMPHSIVGAKPMKSAIENKGTRLLARVRFAKEYNSDWFCHITEPQDVFNFVPLPFATDPNLNHSARFPSDVFDKLALFRSQIVGLAANKQEESCDAKSQFKAVPEYHLIHCPCQESRCCGFLIQREADCMHCSQRNLYKTFLIASGDTKHAKQIDDLRLLTPSEFRKILFSQTSPLLKT